MRSKRRETTSERERKRGESAAKEEGKLMDATKIITGENQPPQGFYLKQK